jgi:HlyD family secretion protein
VTELQLTPEQIEKVDAIYADARPRFMQLRELAPDERPKARERITAEIRARIGDVLTPEQKPRYAALVSEAAGRVVTRGRLYVQGEDGQPRAYSVRLGITDGTATELLVAPGSPEAQALQAGTRVITGTSSPTTAPSRPPAGPRMSF